MALVEVGGEVEAQAPQLFLDLFDGVVAVNGRQLLVKVADNGHPALAHRIE